MGNQCDGSNSDGDDGRGPRRRRAVLWLGLLFMDAAVGEMVTRLLEVWPW